LVLGATIKGAAKGGGSNELFALYKLLEFWGCQPSPQMAIAQEAEGRIELGGRFPKP
jgi:hypothetical protein